MGAGASALRGRAIGGEKTGDHRATGPLIVTRVIGLSVPVRCPPSMPRCASEVLIPGRRFPCNTLLPILDEEALQMALQGETLGIFFGSYDG